VANLRPDLRVENLRGNLDTRIRKLKEGGCEAIIVALAGVQRLSRVRKIAGVKIRAIPGAEMLPAVGQGSLAIEVRENDARAESFIRFLRHGPSEIRALAEREFLGALQGGCRVPIGASSAVRGRKFFMEGVVASPLGDVLVRKKAEGPLKDARSVGGRLALELLELGGREILEQIRHSK
jgi:hydroxymethylbilane synthase